MDIWYTPERIALYQEIDRRRMARYERRAARNARQRRRESILGAVRNALGVLLGVAFFYAFTLFWLL